MACQQGLTTHDSKASYWSMSLFQIKKVLLSDQFSPCMSRSIGMYRFNKKPVNRSLDRKTYLDFLSITTWAQNPCREWNQSVSSLSRAVEGKYIVTLDKELNFWDKTLKDKETTDGIQTELKQKQKKINEHKKKRFLPCLPVLRWLYPVSSEIC